MIERHDQRKTERTSFRTTATRFPDLRRGSPATSNPFVPLPASVGCAAGQVLKLRLELLRDTPTNPARFRKNADILRGRIVSWDAMDDKGRPLPLTQAAMEKIAPQPFWKLFGTVFGRVATDIDPQWEEERQAEEARIAADAALTGESVCRHP